MDERSCASRTRTTEGNFDLAETYGTKYSTACEPSRCLLALFSFASLGRKQLDRLLFARRRSGNLQLHYLAAGKGPEVVILLHGVAETSRMWRPIMPLLAEKFTVIAPDLLGIGYSSISAQTGMLIAARQIHDLARSHIREGARGSS